jgi:hypothetical protein
MVRIPGYESRGPGSIHGTDVHSASWVQLRSYFEERVATPVLAKVAQRRKEQRWEEEQSKVLLLWNETLELRMWSFGDFDRHSCFIIMYTHLGSLPRNFIYRSLMVTPRIHPLLPCALDQSNTLPISTRLIRGLTENFPIAEMSTRNRRKNICWE